jgi:hypothetical protein
VLTVGGWPFVRPEAPAELLKRRKKRALQQ